MANQIEHRRTHDFMVSNFTFLISTLRSKRAGNFVVRRSFLSKSDAMMAGKYRRRSSLHER